MRSELTGVSPRNDHANLEREVLHHAKAKSAGEERRVGVFNEGGVVYWRITTQGEREFADAVKALSARGFSNELQNFRKPVGGYDALMLRT